MVRRINTLLAGAFLMASTCAFAASPQEAETVPTPIPPSQPVSIDEEPRINWRSIVPDIYRDQKSIWTFPVRLAHGHDWKPTLGFTLALGAMIALDPHDTPYFRNNPTFAGFNRGFSARNATLGIVLVPSAFYAVGLVRKDSYAMNTSVMAGEALADAEILSWVLKNATGRSRPSSVPVGGNYADTWFENYQPPLLGKEGFPSGHTIAAFSVATVFARRYGNHRWVPWVAYGAATAIGFSRVSLQAHFPSDVFAGAVFGYVISRYVVLRRHDAEF